MSKPKLIEQIENAGGVFMATYGETTLQEIIDAYKSGKDISVTYLGDIYDLITIPSDNSASASFQRRVSDNDKYATTSHSFVGLDLTNTWGGPYTNKYPQVATSIYNNNSTSISSSTGYYRPIRISTSEPTASDGNIGDIWIQYEE